METLFDVDNDGLKRVKAGNGGKRNAEIVLIRVLAEEESDQEKGGGGGGGGGRGGEEVEERSE
jgi:hypothetical protein